jgi:hypothetical protein
MSDDPAQAISALRGGPKTGSSVETAGQDGSDANFLGATAYSVDESRRVGSWPLSRKGVGRSGRGRSDNNQIEEFLDDVAEEARGDNLLSRPK